MHQSIWLTQGVKLIHHYQNHQADEIWTNRRVQFFYNNSEYKFLQCLFTYCDISVIRDQPNPETLEKTIESSPLCITDLRLAYKKKTKKLKLKFSQKKIIFFLPFFYATFQCGRYNVFNFFFFFFLPTKSWKNHPKKLHP